MGLYIGGLYTGGAYTRIKLLISSTLLNVEFTYFKQKIIEYCHQRDAII